MTTVQRAFRSGDFHCELASIPLGTNSSCHTIAHISERLEACKPESDLVAACQDGCDKACRQLYERYSNQVYRLVYRYRSVFLLREVDQLSYFDIALTLDIAEGTVATRLNRARRELRSLIITAET